MPSPLNTYERRDLDAKLDKAAKVFNRAVVAHERGAFGPHHAEALYREAQGMASLIARFSDGPGWGVLCSHTLDHMLDYHFEAEALLADATPDHDERQTEIVTIAPGRYAVSRVVAINGTHYQHAMPCTNPAVAITELDQWERELHRSLAA